MRMIDWRTAEDKVEKFAEYFILLSDLSENEDMNSLNYSNYYFVFISLKIY
jgi:hypothetical protein